MKKKLLAFSLLITCHIAQGADTKADITLSKTSFKSGDGFDI